MPLRTSAELEIPVRCFIKGAEIFDKKKKDYFHEELNMVSHILVASMMYLAYADQASQCLEFFRAEFRAKRRR